MTQVQIILQPGHVKVFNFVKEFIAKNVFAPSIPEIMKATKLGYRQTYRLVEQLVAMGHFSKQGFNQKRSLKIEKEIK